MVDVMYSFNCAPAGGICCDEGACEAGEKCCPPRNNPSLRCAPTSAVCCGDGYCPSGSTCCEKGCAEPNSVCCDDLQSSCASTDKCCKDEDGIYCATECLPTIIWPFQEDFLEEVR